MKKQLLKRQRAARAKRRTRSKIFGTAAIPRLNVFRSNLHLFVQLIDDEQGRTLVSVHDTECASKKMKKTECAFEVGKLLAKKAMERKISTCVFDRGARRYHGRIAAVGQGAREGGLKF